MPSRNALNLCLLFFLFISTSVYGAEQAPLEGFAADVFVMVQQCKKDIENEFNKMLSSDQLTMNQLFDTFYVPIPHTYPQKYHTQYDKIADERLRIILDKYLARDDRILFVVAVDRNGYLPTHNSKYSKPLTRDADYNTKNNRTKRLFNDRTGLAAARNKEPYLLQKYDRDTGESFFDLSAPLFVKDKHWGAIRFGFRK
jgi:hypothetical protein